ncbi:MAG: hypothetical protein KKB59_10660 [Spirochaetes bacterium]|nr:hypothetical protein [Spirochaetota bacterium]
MSAIKFGIRFAIAALGSFAVAAWLQSSPPATWQGRLYSESAALREAVTPDQSILLIEASAAEGAMDTAAWAEILTVLQELGADKVVSLLRMDAGAAPGALSSERRSSLESRFAQEFSRIESNVANLFEAIRLGSVRPKDSARFVDELLALVAESGSGLLSEVVDGGDAGLEALERARATFGPGRIGVDAGSVGFEAPEYLRGYAVAELPSPLGGELPFPRLGLGLLSDYSELDARLYRAFAAMEREGYLGASDPGSRPVAMYEHARGLRRDMMALPGEAATRAWREARATYLRSASEALAPGAEAGLLSGFDGLLASEGLDEAGTESARAMRAAAVDSFADARGLLASLQPMRARLKDAVGGSVCVLGAAPDPLRPPESIWLRPTPAESAAAFVNAAMTGRFVYVPSGTARGAWVIAAGLVSAAALAASALAPFGLAASAAIGLASVAASAAFYLVLFKASGVWVNPAYAAAAVAAGAALAIGAEAVMNAARAASIRGEAGARMPAAVVGAIVSGKADAPGGLTNAGAAILAIRHIGASVGPEAEDSRSRAASLRDFHEAAAREITRGGGIVLGAEDFIVVAGFGTPLARAAAPRLAGSPSDQAVKAAFAIALSSDPAIRAWRIGLDFGECSYFRSAITGYCAVGRAVSYARILSGLASKYGGGVLATDDFVAEAGGSVEARRLDSLVQKASGAEEAFYELIVPARR